LTGASGAAVLNAYIVGFELECRLGVVMNPRHYHDRGWHCTSSIGTLGSAAAAARLLGLDAPATVHALALPHRSLAVLKKTSEAWLSRSTLAWLHATGSWPLVLRRLGLSPANKASMDHRATLSLWTAKSLHRLSSTLQPTSGHVG